MVGFPQSGENAVQPDPTTAEIFLHIRVVMGIVLGFGITRLLAGAAKFVQHPHRQRPDLVHLGWAFSLLLMLVHFWWWEFWLSAIPMWTFGIYLFLIVYTIVLFLLCALLFPDDIAEYSGYRDYFMSRRQWFFGLLAVSYLLDLIDTLIKGRVHFEQFGPEYMIRIAAYVLLCLVAMQVSDRRFHVAFVVASLVYQVSFIFRLFDTLN